MQNTSSESTENGRKRGAQPGNRNRMRHGLRGGKLPPKLQYIEHRLNSLRRTLEDAVVALRSEVSIVDAACINSAAKWERHGLLAQHWLRHEVENMSVTDRLKFSEAIAKASDNRDKNIKALGLDIKREPIKLAEYVEESGK